MAKNNNLTDFLTGVADAIRAKKGTFSTINPQDFESEIETIQTGVDTADATATAADIRAGKTAYVNEEKVEGSIQDYNGESEPASGKSLFARMVDRSITEVTAEDLAGITKIGIYAFYYIKTLANVTIPNGVTTIGMSAFQNCTNLMNVTIPNSVTIIRTGAFKNCSVLREITIPNSVKTLESELFTYCHNLNNITIPNGIFEISGYMFTSCTNLTLITIPDSVTRIGPQAFYDCSTDTELGGTYAILATTPPTIHSNTFQYAKINKIIVPAGTSAAYKAATNWSALADKIEEATE